MKHHWSNLARSRSREKRQNALGGSNDNRNAELVSASNWSTRVCDETAEHDKKSACTRRGGVIQNLSLCNCQYPNEGARNYDEGA
jgi:hypothetical protein